MKRLSLGFAVLFVAIFAVVYFVRDRPSEAPSVLASEALSQPPTVEITYIANEGVLISAGGKQVLIDGLHWKRSSFSHKKAQKAQN